MRKLQQLDPFMKRVFIALGIFLISLTLVAFSLIGILDKTPSQLIVSFVLNVVALCLSLVALFVVRKKC